MRESSELEVIRRIFNDDGFEVGYERVESIEEHDKKVREDAIDKFAEKIKHHIMNDWNMDLSDCDECVFCVDKVNEIAEQLKEQKNELV